MARPPKEQDVGTFAGRVGAEIRRRRVRRKLSVDQAAAAAGMPAKTWYHCESGRHLTLARLPAIAAALDCRAGQLLPE